MNKLANLSYSVWSYGVFSSSQPAAEVLLHSEFLMVCFVAEMELCLAHLFSEHTLRNVATSVILHSGLYVGIQQQRHGQTLVGYARNSWQKQLALV